MTRIRADPEPLIWSQPVALAEWLAALSGSQCRAEQLIHWQAEGLTRPRR